MSKISDVLKLAKYYHNRIPMDEDGKLELAIVPLTEEYIVDMNDMFKQQLKQEGKYGWWACCSVHPGQGVTMDRLPIYGDKDRYVTKFFYSDMEDAVKKELADRELDRYSRIIEYEENRKILQD